VPSTYALLLQSQGEHSRVFGQMLRRWRTANSWTQYTAETWAAEAGFLTLGHGTTSELENGKLKAPGLKAFLFLHEVNRRVAAEDWSGVTTRKLKDTLLGSRPILDAQGQAWSVQQWWAAHKGLEPIPEWLTVPEVPAPTDAEAAAACGRWLDGLREVARASRASSTQLANAYQFAPAEHQERWHEVLLNLRDYSGEELAQLWDAKAQEWQPAQWVKAWARSLDEPNPTGGGASREHDLILSEMLRVS
jgi:transcriptional regulator with XRE-family HTH domain